MMSQHRGRIFFGPDRDASSGARGDPYRQVNYAAVGAEKRQALPVEVAALDITNPTALSRFEGLFKEMYFFYKAQQFGVTQAAYPEPADRKSVV